MVYYIVFPFLSKTKIVMQKKNYFIKYKTTLKNGKELKTINKNYFKSRYRK